ncbi:MAG: glucose-1-phosphate adenylyltransferase subunit GlgD [Clostridia bacterium]|nr:glucose-1-phosphate adenylyltransferase subunit GlgD [Clostridia bacterium]
MRANNFMGIVFSNVHEECISELTSVRTMGSVPFGGRYRMIDFPLSMLVNNGISKVGVITKRNYRSLMDHLGTGKSWDLSRKRDGMIILPPFDYGAAGLNHGKMESLRGISNFIERADEEYVVITDSNVLCNFDLEEMIKSHGASGADITIAYKRGKKPSGLDNLMTFTLGRGKRITEIAIDEKGDSVANYSLNIFIMRKLLLQRLISTAMSHNLSNFERDVIQSNVDSLKICGYRVDDFAITIDSLAAYYRANISLLDNDVRRALFTRERPVYTKIHDEMPALYGEGSNVSNSLIADGCVIEGTVENSILFRGVHIAKGAVVRNSIIMQGSKIGEKAEIDCVITDKNVTVKPRVSLKGAKTYPIYIGKNSVV